MMELFKVTYEVCDATSREFKEINTIAIHEKNERAAIARIRNIAYKITTLVNPVFKVISVN
jgi:hypothetical protein